MVKQAAVNTAPNITTNQLIGTIAGEKSGATAEAKKTKPKFAVNSDTRSS